MRPPLSAPKDIEVQVVEVKATCTGLLIALGSAEFIPKSPKTFSPQDQTVPSVLCATITSVAVAQATNFQEPGTCVGADLEMTSFTPRTPAGL